MFICCLWFNIFILFWLGSPPNCTEVTICSSNPCQNGGSCVLLPNNQFNCSCLSGYTGIYVIKINKLNNTFEYLFKEVLKNIGLLVVYSIFV